MQRIDVMISMLNNEQKIVVPIELKAVEANETNIFQIQRYIDWLKQYYLPNRSSDIRPILISKTIADKNNSNFKKIIESFKKFNNLNKSDCNKLQYIEFSIQKNDLVFKQINY